MSQASTSSRGEPLELIHYNSSTGKFEVGEESLSVLKALKGPVSVVAVCGRARQVSSTQPSSSLLDSNRHPMLIMGTLTLNFITCSTHPCLPPATDT